MDKTLLKDIASRRTRTIANQFLTAADFRIGAIPIQLFAAVNLKLRPRIILVQVLTATNPIGNPITYLKSRVASTYSQVPFNLPRLVGEADKVNMDVESEVDAEVGRIAHIEVVAVVVDEAIESQVHNG